MRDKPIQPVRFTQKQLEELEKLFPRVTHRHKTSMEEIREYFGQQTVIDEVRKRVQH